MARSTKAAKAKRSRKRGASHFGELKTNSRERRDGTRDAGLCQLCLEPHAIKDQYTVVNDLEAGVAKKAKNADKHPDLSHYCADCADKRKARKEYWMEKVREASGPDQRGQRGGRKKATRTRTRKAAGKAKAAKGAAKGKRKRTRTRKAAEPKGKSRPKPKKARKARKAKATQSSAAEPF